MLVPHDSKTRRILAGLIAQHLPDMTEEEMECWIQHPEGLPAVLAGLKPLPNMPAGAATAPLHVGSPRRQELADSLPVAVVNVGNGAVAHVTLLADVLCRDSGPTATGQYAGDLESVAGQLA